jgi:hypothetical protein
MTTKEAMKQLNMYHELEKKTSSDERERKPGNLVARPC